MTSPTMQDAAAEGRGMEDEANEFAMHLLMPTKFLRAELAKLGGIDIEDEKAVQKLAKKFAVSQQIMTLRLGQLLLRPEANP